MAADITVPTLGESVTTATIARWMKKVGDNVAADEPLVELETDKVTVEINAPEAGVISEIIMPEGSEVEIGAVLGRIGGAGAATAAAPVAAKPATVASPGVHAQQSAPGPVARPGVAPLPAAAKLMEEQKIAPADIGTGTAKDGRISKGDVLAFVNKPTPAAVPAAAKAPRATEAREERVKMTRLRKTIASRLKEAQNTAAMLTTFNEVDMSAIMGLRAEYKDAFEKKHKGVRLGFNGFFVKAVCAALAEFPAVNAEIDGDDIVYKNFVHMGIAVGGANGLVVPVIRDADQMSIAQIEAAIAGFAKAAKEGTLKLEQLSGGTFSITNGGVYGSLMSTPILNPPQSAILGMHKIQDRPVAIAGKVEIRPMMYLAVSYDHRIIDGREAVSFLVRVKESLEDPRRLLLAI
ncbi:MAG: dihydrolipoamide succinyltransferase [Acidocella sp. 35-58-6]|nr:MAG: dihydrolipoamide succinyltransferase [Acidocella sp. 35-58-6]